MDIKPTIVEVKDIVILDTANYGDNVLIQVLGYENATSPLSVPYDTLLSFVSKVQEMHVGPQAAEVPPEVEMTEKTVTRKPTEFVS